MRKLGAELTPFRIHLEHLPGPIDPRIQNCRCSRPQPDKTLPRNAIVMSKRRQSMAFQFPWENTLELSGIMEAVHRLFLSHQPLNTAYH